MEENNTGSTIKTRSFRIDTETADTFKQIADEHGLNQNDTMQLLISAYELNGAKNALPDAKKDIEDYMAHVTSLQNAFLHLLDINQNTEEKIYQKYQRKLENDEAVIEELRKRNASITAELNAKITEEKSAREQAEKIADGAAKAAAQAVKDAEAAKEQAETANSLVEEKKKMNEMLAAKLTEAEEKLSGYDDLKASETVLTEKVHDLQRTIEENKKDFEHTKEVSDAEHTHQIELLKAGYDKQIADLNIKITSEKEHADEELDRKLTEQKKDCELALEKALIAKERELNQQLRDADKENARLQAKIEDLEARIAELTAKKE